jgi:hypothetical protein
LPTIRVLRAREGELSRESCWARHFPHDELNRTNYPESSDIFLLMEK